MALGARADPDVWVVMFGPRSRIAEVMTDLSGEERQVVWVGQPIPRVEGFARRMVHLNDLYRAEAGHHEGVTFVDSWELFAGLDGGYTAYLPDPLGRSALITSGTASTSAGLAAIAWRCRCSRRSPTAVGWARQTPSDRAPPCPGRMGTYP